eukprot:6193791-Amphidinium_carterae.1
MEACFWKLIGDMHASAGRVHSPDVEPDHTPDLLHNSGHELMLGSRAILSLLRSSCSFVFPRKRLHNILKEHVKD